jgi:proteasome alpha subunit
MSYTPYDWQQTLSQKIDYVEDRLSQGSPVIGVSCKEGILLLTTRRTQGKIFEIYDRLAFAGLGNPSDLEAIRQSTVDFCHAEGFQRSPEDVTIQRVVGFAISPAMKRNFAEPFRTPLILRALFAQVGREAKDDLYFTLNYDGEFAPNPDYAAIAGTGHAIEYMERVIEGDKGKKSKSKTAPTLEQALKKAFKAWATGVWALRSQRASGDENETEKLPSETELKKILKQVVEEAEFEVALFERTPERDRRLNYFDEEDLKPYLP